jgi:hypothetical protein
MLELELRGFWNWKAQAQIRPEKPPRKYKLSKLGLEIFLKRKNCATLLKPLKVKIATYHFSYWHTTYEVDKNNKATMHNIRAQNQ